MSVGTYSAKDVADFVYKDGESQAIQIANKSEEIINIDHALSTNVLTGEYEVFVPDGKVTIGHWEGNPTTPAVSETAIQTTSNVGTAINPYNSNSTEIVRGSVKQAYNTSVENGQVKISSTPKSGSFGTNAAYILGEVNAASAAVGVGTSLGKVIGNELYNANPDMWSGIDISQMDSTWWDRIIADNPYNSFLMNAIFGIDVNGNAQAYVNEDAYAYLAQYMASKDFFNNTMIGQIDDDVYPLPNYFTYPANVYTSNLLWYAYNFINDPTLYSTCGIRFSVSVNILPYYSSVSSNGKPCGLLVASTTPFTYGYNDGYSRNPIPSYPNSSSGYNPDTVRVNNVTIYYKLFGVSGGGTRWLDDSPIASNPMNSTSFPENNNLYFVLANAQTQAGGVEGITNQDGATLPNVDTWDTPQNTLDSLKQQYPDLWNDALTYDVPDADGNLQPQTWVPIPWPEIAPNVNPWLNTQPTTNTDLGTQTQTQVNLRTIPDTLTQPLTTTLTQPITDTPTPDVPQNPNDTGSGDSPIPVAPTGQASALWSVYHPTQAQVNAFGAWLWTDNIITQFIQAMNNPMDGIITLHKIFAQPVDSGNGTIVIGRLDSQVPTALVTQQYVSVDCGYVSVQEYFGNVFDYVGTQISIYLPFIGIQPLNVDDVMRSTLNVVYEVDLFTGACLATIHVNRDGYNPMMYQFTGVCSVEYPLTGGQHSSIINGFFGLMGAGVATAAGPAGPIAAGVAAIGMASSINQIARTQNARSGAFGANAGAMGIKKPYLIISRPQTKVARQDTHYTGYPTNYTDKVSAFTGMVKARQVHVEGVNATDTELEQIESLLKEGILV